MGERGTCWACGLTVEVSPTGPALPHRDRLGKLCQGTGDLPAPVVAEQRVSDEQLTELEAQAGMRRTMPAPSYLALIADLRASRAREVELQQRLEQQRAGLATAYEEAHNATHRAQDLQQRIDKALVRLDRAEPRQWRRVAVMRYLHAALTGKEPTDG